MTRAVFLIAGVALALGACVRTVEERELIVERIIDPAPAARALPVCVLPAPGNTHGWRRADGERIALPPSFEADSAALPPGVTPYGGRAWSDPAGRTFARIEGHWDVSDNPDACHADINGALVVVVVGADSIDTWVDAWPVSRSARPTPRYGGSGFDAADQQLFLRILQTYRAPSDD